MKRVDFSGKKFAHWTVLSYESGSRLTPGRWNCRCEKCGTLHAIRQKAVSNGQNAFCPTCNVHPNQTHGHARNGAISPTWNSWASMRDRCERPGTNDYAIYGGRGITVCQRWSDFAAFLEDMGERPVGHQLDRIDSNGHYEPSNCRWITIQKQQHNRRDNTFVTLNGERMVCREAERRLGITRGILGRKMRRLNWPAIDLALVDCKQPIAVMGPQILCHLAQMNRYIPTPEEESRMAQ